MLIEWDELQRQQRLRLSTLHDSNCFQMSLFTFSLTLFSVPVLVPPSGTDTSMFALDPFSVGAKVRQVYR